MLARPGAFAARSAGSAGNDPEDTPTLISVITIISQLFFNTYTHDLRFSNPFFVNQREGLINAAVTGHLEFPKNHLSDINAADKGS